MAQEPGKRIVSKDSYALAQWARGGLVLLGVILLLLTLIAFLITTGLLFASVALLGLGGALFAAVPAILTYYLAKWTTGTIQKFKQIDPGIPPTRANIGYLPAVDTLVRASEEPIQGQAAVLLRAATEKMDTQEEQLLRATAEQK